MIKLDLARWMLRQVNRVLTVVDLVLVMGVEAEAITKIWVERFSHYKARTEAKP